MTSSIRMNQDGLFPARAKAFAHCAMIALLNRPWGGSFRLVMARRRHGIDAPQPAHPVKIALPLPKRIRQSWDRKPLKSIWISTPNMGFGHAHSGGDATGGAASCRTAPRGGRIAPACRQWARPDKAPAKSRCRRRTSLRWSKTPTKSATLALDTFLRTPRMRPQMSTGENQFSLTRAASITARAKKPNSYD
jgi:hypothetical protein